MGKGGAKLQELETKTATKISIPKASDSSDKITVTGPKDGIDKALHEIRIISDEQVSHLNWIFFKNTLFILVLINDDTIYLELSRIQTM